MLCRICDNVLQPPPPERSQYPGGVTINVCLTCGDIKIWEGEDLRELTLEEWRAVRTVRDPLLQLALEHKAEMN